VAQCERPRGGTHGGVAGRLRTGARRTITRARGGGRRARPRPRGGTRGRAPARAAPLLHRRAARPAPGGGGRRRVRGAGGEQGCGERGGAGASDRVSDRAGLRNAKLAMRARMRELRGAIPSAERDRLAAQIEERLFGLTAVGAATTVMLFS